MDAGSGSLGNGLCQRDAGHGSFSPYRLPCGSAGAAASSLPPCTSTPSGILSVPAAERHPGAVPHKPAGGQGSALIIQGWRKKHWEKPEILCWSRTA